MKSDINEIDRKSIITALAIINNNLKLDKVKGDSSSLYSIKSSDGVINYNIDLNNTKENSFDTLKSLLEYCYDNSEYTRGNINDDCDAFEWAYKYCNAIMLDIDNEGVKMGEEMAMKNSVEIKVTPTQFNLFMSIVEADNIISSVFENGDNAYSILVCARFVAESIQQANLFMNSLDLLDFIRVIYSFSQSTPCHEDEALLKFVEDMLATLRAS